MPVAILNSNRIQDQLDANLTLGAGTDGYAIVWDNTTGKFVMAAAGGSSLPVVDETAIVYKTGNAAITATLDADSLTTARTYTLPDVSSTVAVLGTAQTFTAAQTINAPNAASSALILNDYASQSADIVQIYRSDAKKMLTFERGSGTYGQLSLYHNGQTPVRLYNDSGAINITIDSATAVFRLLPNSDNIYFQNTASTGDIYFTGNGGGYLSGQTIFRTRGMEAQYSAALTTTVAHVLEMLHYSTSTPAAGFGAALRFGLQSSTTADQNAARLVASWSTATHASRAADLIGYASDYGGEREIWRGRASGTAPQFAVLGATPVARQAHIADPSGGSTVDAEARTAINSILAALENFGFLATS